MQPGDEQLPHGYVEHFLDGKLYYVSLGNSSIPVCPGNSDYERYLEWKKTGLKFDRVDDDTIQTTDEKRKAAYNAAWTNDEFQEAVLENAMGKPEKLQSIISKRDEIKTQIPKGA